MMDANLEVATAMQTADDTTLETINCPACDSHHIGCAIRAYKTPKPPATHWYICPTTGDPVDVALVHCASKEIAIAAEALAMIARAMVDGTGWMMATWRLEGTNVHYSRKSFQFPIVDYQIAVKQIKDDLEAEAGPQQPPQMETVQPERLKPIVDLFGDSITVSQQGE